MPNFSLEPIQVNTTSEATMPSTAVVNSATATSEGHPEVEVTPNSPANDLENDLAAAVASLSLEKVPEPVSKTKNDLSNPVTSAPKVKEGENDLGSSDEDNNRDEEAIVGLNDLSGTVNLSAGAEVKRGSKVKTNEEEEDEDEESGTYTSKGNNIFFSLSIFHHMETFVRIC